MILALGVLAGCSHKQPNAPVQHLFATVPETGVIVLYPTTATGLDRPLATIKERPPDKPIDVSVDLLGDVFVANENGNVQVYGGRDFHYIPIRSVEGPHTRIVHPTSVVTDIAGSFYVAEGANAKDPARVEWFAAGLNGNVPPDRVVSGPQTGISTPRGITMDGSGRLFVADQASNKVLVFAADANDNAPPLAVLTGLKSPERVFVDQVLNVYVTNKDDNSIAVFMTTGPQSWARSGTITSAALRDPQGVAADAEGRIAVAGVGGILFFAPNSNGLVEPIVNLRGASPMNPEGIFIR
ncbi:MAG TPA: hypothetical protein VJN94_03685 [Candidatus Binataceae bacterium]|nr:hypothetical protein [Candidatus Binataceae bacterium]